MRGYGARLVGVLIACIGVAIAGYAADPNILVDAVHQDVRTVDPARGNNYLDTIVAHNLYDALVFPDSDGNLLPMLAASWTASSDGLSYTFTLDSTAVFHDGSSVTAEDVKFSMERSIALGQGFSWIWSGIISDVTVDGPLAVTFHLEVPYSPFLASLPLFKIVNKDVVMENVAEGDFGEFGDYGVAWFDAAASGDAGSGPYQMKSLERGYGIVLERFPEYFLGWPNGDKSVDEAHLLLLKENATVKTMMRSGEATMTGHYRSFDDYMEIDAYPNAKLSELSSLYIEAAKMNTKLAPTDDIHIRRMLAYAFDYDTFCEVVSGGCVRAYGYVPPSLLGYNPRLYAYEFDLEKAQEELEKSKYYPNVPDITFTYVTGQESRRQMALLLQENLAKLGVNLVIQPENFGGIIGRTSTPETTPNLLLITQDPPYADADAVLYATYHSGGAGTWMSAEWLQSPLVDELITAQKTVIDPEDRAHQIEVIQQLIAEECTDIYLELVTVRNALQDYVMGMQFRPIKSGWYYFHDLWFDR
ncbi:ABC transporter substrate-binding protein [Candidatus Bipolaricaulota bacterium]